MICVLKGPDDGTAAAAAAVAAPSDGTAWAPARRAALGQAFVAAREETLMLVALLTAVLAIWFTPAVASPDRTAWIAVLVVQALPYLCALLMSLISALPLPASWISSVSTLSRSGIKCP